MECLGTKNEIAKEVLTKNSPKIKMRLGEGTTKSLALSNTHHDFTNENFVIPVHYGEKT